MNKIIYMYKVYDQIENNKAVDKLEREEEEGKKEDKKGENI